MAFVKTSSRQTLAVGADAPDLVDRRVVWLVLTLATAVAAALRLPFLSHQSLWFDEIFTRAVLGRHTLVGIWDQVRTTESTPPLYYLVAKLSTLLAGVRSAAAMRAPSALALTAAVPVAYLAFRRPIGQRGALVAATFVAVNPLLVSYSTDARSYGLLVLTALLSLWGFTAALEGGTQRAYAAWALASVACVWTHYFGAFTVVAEALILLLLRPRDRRATLAWSLAVAICAATLIPLLVHQSGSEDSAFIAGISLATRLEQTVRQFAMGPNVPRTWLEFAGLIVIAACVVTGSAMALARPGPRILLAVTVITVGVPLACAVVGIDDHFYVRNVIVAVPLVGALTAPALLRLRAAPLVAYLALAVVASVWVATNWRYEQADWRTAIAHAQELDAGLPVLTVGVDSSNVAATYLARTSVSGTVMASRALLIVQPYRAAGDRALVAAPVPEAVTAALRGFATTSVTVVHGFTLIVLAAARPVALAAANLPGVTVFPAPGG